jgi:hypothetical protein
MSGVWSAKGKAKSWIEWQNQPVHLDALAAAKQPGSNHEQCFVIPAQRVMAFSSQSWLRPFSDFPAGDPYVLRGFSEHLRVQAESIFDTRKRILRLDDEAYFLLQEAIFGSFDLAAQATGGQKELVLTRGSKKPLPFMVWSAGQREFVPLLLALIWLLPASRTRQKQRQDFVIVEEPEMGSIPRQSRPSFLWYSNFWQETIACAFLPTQPMCSTSFGCCRYSGNRSHREKPCWICLEWGTVHAFFSLHRRCWKRTSECTTSTRQLMIPRTYRRSIPMTATRISIVGGADGLRQPGGRRDR